MTREPIEHMPDDDWRKRDPRFREPRLSPNLELVERLAAVADRHGTTRGAVAIAWTLRNPAVDGASSASAGLTRSIRSSPRLVSS